MGTLAAVRKLHARPVEAVEHWRAWSLGGGNLFVKTPDPSTQQRIELLVPSHRICWCSRFVAGFLVYRFFDRPGAKHGLVSLPGKDKLRYLPPSYAGIYFF